MLTLYIIAEVPGKNKADGNLLNIEHELFVINFDS